MQAKKTNDRPIVLASPHARNDLLQSRLQSVYPGRELVRIRSADQLDFVALKRLEPEYVFFPHWSWIIPEDIFSRFECVIFHMTDLPYGRGGSPLQNLIVRGHQDTKLTALKCVKQLDAGPVYMKRNLSLHGTAEEILQRASNIIEEMIIEIINRNPIPTSQEGEVTVFTRRQPKDGDLSGLAELSKVFDFIRMLDADGYPHAFLDTGALHLEFTDATLFDEYLEARVKIRTKENG